jgi:uncharacterized coiled-coil protein SlyX
MKRRDPALEHVKDLQVKFTFLEQHVGAQDRVILHLTERIEALERQLQSVLERVANETGATAVTDEPPPHY